MDITLNDVAREVLDGPHIAAIATSNADGRPQSSLIFVKRDDDTVVFSTIKGRLKTRNMTRDRASACWLSTRRRGATSRSVAR
jgi:pyridoxine/pyridoxamine 5'-phosphate oxidase